MSDLHHRDPEDLILDFVEDPVIPLTNPIPILARELLGTYRTRVVGEGLNARNNTPPILRGQLSQLFGGGPLDLDAITCHAASDP